MFFSLYVFIYVIKDVYKLMLENVFIILLYCIIANIMWLNLVATL